MKNILLAAALSAAASTAFAGSIAEPVVEPIVEAPVVVEEAEPSSGAALVPLFLLGVLLIAVSD